MRLLKVGYIGTSEKGQSAVSQRLPRMRGAVASCVRSARVAWSKKAKWNGDMREASDLQVQRIACLLYEAAMAYLPRKRARVFHKF